MKGGYSVILRPITREDTPLIVRWRNNPRVREGFVYRVPFTEEIHEKWFSERIEGSRDVVQWILCEERPDGSLRPVGSTFLREVDRGAGTAEYGIFIGEDDAVGHGYGNEAVNMVCSYAARVLKLERIYLRVFVDNEPARKSYEQAGFVITERRKDVVLTDGTKRDMFMMERKLV